MNEQEIARHLEDAIERLASIEHERWAHWQQYMHSKGQQQPDGAMIIPAELVAQWSRQIRTPYEELPLPERESDREQVRRYLPTIVAILANQT